MAAAKQLAREAEQNERLRKEIADVRLRSRPPEVILCPITTEIMVDPVVAADGHTYERKAIEAWLRNNNTSPKTNLQLKHKELIPNQAVRELVREFLDDCARTGVNPDSLV